MKDQNSAQRPLVVCLHGSAGDSGMWHSFRKAARGRCRVIAPRLPGLGHQPLADDVASVLVQTRFAHEPFHLVAHGRGAAVAAGVANLAPERVASLVAYEPAGLSCALEQGLRIPVQVLSGTHSWRAARQRAEGVAERVAGARLLKLVGLRHMAPLTHPHCVNAVILDYILPVNMPGPGVAV